MVGGLKLLEPPTRELMGDRWSLIAVTHPRGNIAIFVTGRSTGEFLSKSLDENFTGDLQFLEQGLTNLKSGPTAHTYPEYQGLGQRK